jgi:hypothetical protein
MAPDEELVKRLRSGPEMTADEFDRLRRLMGTAATIELRDGLAAIHALKRKAADRLEAQAAQLVALSVGNIVREIYGDHVLPPRQMYRDAAYRMIEDATIDGGDYLDPTVRSHELADAFARALEAAIAAAEKRIKTLEEERDRYREALRTVVTDYDGCSGAEPSLSALHRSIDVLARNALRALEAQQ